MAVICTKDVDTNISTANGFWRVEAQRLGSPDNSTRIDLSTTRTINVTFANAGDLKKVGLCFTNGSTHGASASQFRSVTVELRESGTPRASVTVTGADLYNNVPFSNVDKSNPTTDGMWYTFEGFNYPVTTTGGVWTLVISQTSPPGTSQNNFLRTDNGAESGLCYFAVCNNQLTATTGDVVIADKVVTIDQSFNFTGTLTGNSTTNSVCAIACSSKEALSVNYPRFVIDSPASAITIVIRGYFLISQNSGIRFGTEANPIPRGYVDVTLSPATAGTAANTNITTPYFATGSSSAKGVFEMWGEHYTNKTATIATTALTGATTIDIVEDRSGEWQIGDELVLGGQGTASGVGDTTGGWDSTQYFITNITSTTITLDKPIATYRRYAGYKIINLSGDGIRFTQNITTSVAIVMSINGFSRQLIKGVHFNGVTVSGGGNSGPSGFYSGEIPSNRVKMQIQDCTFSNSGASTHMTILGTSFVPYEGFFVKRCVIRNGNIATGETGAQQIASIWLEENLIEDVTVMNMSAFNSFGTSAMKKPIIRRVYMEKTLGGNSGWIILGTSNVLVEDCVFLNHRNGTWAFMGLNNAINCTINRCKWNGIQGAYAIRARGSTFGLQFNECEFGQDSPVAFTAGIETGIFSQMQFNNCKGSFVTDSATIDAADGSIMTVVDNNQTPNFDLNYLQRGNIVRCGTGLADTTVRSSGFSLRMESLSTLPLMWSQNIPTGDIQGKSMTAGMWVKINSANYWSGTHQMPRITIDYDNGTTVYEEATQTTDWQFVPVTFTPTTGFGQITVTLSSQTDQSGSDAYVYFDDFTAPLPQGSSLNLGTLSLWADGFPVAPMSFASVISSADVWAADPDTFGTGTVGEKVNKIKNDTGIIPATL